MMYRTDSQRYGVMEGITVIHKKSCLNYWMWIALIYVLISTANTSLSFNKNCNEKEFEQREQIAKVIFSGKVKDLKEDEKMPGIRSGLVEIINVMKGESILVNYPGLQGKLEDNYHKLVLVEGFGNPIICVNSVRVGDTRIFLLDYLYGDFYLNSSILSMSVYNLAKTRAAVSDIPFNQPAPQISPCLGHFCPFYAKCEVRLNSTQEGPYCVCSLDCSDYLPNPVCGTNQITYDNECELKTASCQTQRRIRVFKRNSCQKDPCDGVTCPDKQVCRLNEEREPVCKCDGNCEPTMAPVCGSDGRTYSNDCMLRQEACLTGRDITVYDFGECNEENPCTSLNCGPNRDCSIDRQGRATCVCPSYCEQIIRPICADNGVQFDNLCELRSYGCRTNTAISVSHSGACVVDVTETHNACDGEVCEYDANCVAHGKQIYCQCPECSEEYDPVCGTNSIVYENECKMRQENCKERKRTKVEHQGHCMSSGCEKNSIACQFYSVCKSDGVTSRCVCPDSCQSNEANVCGTDGVTYQHECDLRMASCKKQERILIAKYEECEDCGGIQCKYGAKCHDGVCGCPVVCPLEYQPVCGSDRSKYNNKCELDKEGCRSSMELTVVPYKLCEDPLDIPDEGSGSGTLECDENVCQYGGTCHLDEDGYYKCHCSFSCDALRSPVCGSDGRLYGNQCEMQAAACDQQTQINIQASENCDEIDEALCDGKQPVRNNNTNEDYQCSHGSDCPPNSYCHLQYQRCCQEESLSDMFISDCSDSPYGCCSDLLTPATGPRQAGCPDTCQCYMAGSLGPTCDPISKQCNCKPGIGGPKCNMCLPGYWGIHIIEQDRHAGCISCNCHAIGASRADCRQMTGRCICRDNYEGLKCDRCKHSKGMAGSKGCGDDYLTPTASPHSRGSHKTTRRHINTSASAITKQLPSETDATEKPPAGYKTRIGDLCSKDILCDIPNSHCQYGICKCDNGYIATFQSTRCSEVATPPSEETSVIDPDFNACSLNPCLNRGVCQLDDSLGYRCLCALGRTGSTCTAPSSFTTPSFTSTSYLVLRSLGNVTGDFYLDIVFQSMNRDGILLFSSQYDDGTGQFISIAISNSHVEYRFDFGTGPLQILHPHAISQDGYHQVVAKRLGQSAMLIVDDAEPITVVSPRTQGYINLSGNLYLGSLPRNMSLVLEKVGMNMGLVGCIKSLVAGHTDLAQIYNLEYPNPSTHILAGIDVGPCHVNPCQGLPCANGGTCIMLGDTIYECLCTKGYTGNNCETALDLCTHEPCLHGGSCSISSTGDILCRCTPDREGEFCEYEKLANIDVPEFLGDGYLMLPVKEIMASHTSIEIWFKTSTRNGVLLMSSQYLGGIGDFITLNIVDLILEFRFDLGDGVVVIRSTESLVLDKWHRVVVERTKKDAEMVLDDGQPITGQSKGFLQELQSSGKLLLGGYKDSFDVPEDSDVKYNLTGVIQRLFLNGRLIENPLQTALEHRNVVVYESPQCNINPCINGGVCKPHLDAAECKCRKRFAGMLCEKSADQQAQTLPVLFDGQTFLQYKNEITITQSTQRTNNFSFRFRTESIQGLLLYQGMGLLISDDYLAVAISNGFVELSYNLGKQHEGNLFQITSTVYVSDNVWHVVYIHRDRKSATLQVDDEVALIGQSDNGATQLDTNGLLWIGGKEDLPRDLPMSYYKGFTGCLGNIYISDVDLNLSENKFGQTRQSLEYCH